MTPSSNPRYLALFAAVVFSLLSVACGETTAGVGEPLASYDAGAPIAASSPAPTSTSDSDCVEGATRSCRVQLGKNGDVDDCFVGVEICSDGEWGPCGEADVSSGDSGAGGEGPK